ncbi:MAG: tRNA (adenosine(37)-N6)-threonylcarbamoyltransferase complex ATPase subunit type 1 TsaE [Lachnospiraceae bacterium]|nr:tRNA (adenosine(37)-N6)-threonylcarbamoyltransferase complex ATPase subunit type 1 TsaE [Lachnospiraceae bacterium]
MTEVFETFTPEETFEIAERIGRKAGRGAVYALFGDLGVGKTVFSKGFAKGLGVTETVVSPTFTILREYRSGRLPMYHFDVYRIEEPEEMNEIGFREYFYGDGVSLVEWADQIPELIPRSAVRITISKDPSKGFGYRKITAEWPETEEHDDSCD